MTSLYTVSVFKFLLFMLSIYSFLLSEKRFLLKKMHNNIKTLTTWIPGKLNTFVNENTLSTETKDSHKMGEVICKSYI